MGGVTPPPPQRIGLLGGTFDPPHIGHLWLAETARFQLHLDRVLFLPVGQPPHKQEAKVTAVAHRLAMTQRAIAGCPHFLLDTTDMERPLPHTTDTLFPLIHHTHPESQLWLLIGTDSLNDFPTWHKPHMIIKQSRLAVLPRAGTPIDWDSLRAAVPGIDTAIDLLDGPTMTVSSTDIRRWAREGQSVRYLVPAAVWEYIQQTKLYDG